MTRRARKHARDGCKWNEYDSLVTAKNKTKQNKTKTRNPQQTS